MRRVRLLAVLVLLLSGPRPAQAQAVPQAAAAAEAAGQWDEAIRVYRQVLDREPQRIDLWVRLSQVYAMTNAPLNALNAIRHARTLAPNDPDYLRAEATLATWHGDYQLAARSYRQLAAIEKTDDDVMLNLARVSAWAGETDQAVRAYHRYLAAYPQADAVWLELARAESWRGNYGAALDGLGAYHDRFGDSAAYSRELASILARSGRPSDAMKLLAPLLDKDPSNFELNVTRTIALASEHRPRETMDALDTVRRLKPSDPETRTAERLVRTTLGPTVEPQISTYSDSDHLRVTRVAAAAATLLPTGTELSAGYEHRRLEAPAAGGLGRLNGEPARYDYGWAAAAQKIGRVTIDGHVGSASEDTHSRTPYGVGALIRSDTLSLRMESSDEFFVISPRTVDLGLTDRRQHADVEWDPGVLYHVSAGGSYQRISDGNNRWELLVSPRRVVARTESLNLDLGLAAYMLGTSRDLPDGYYDPRRYESYVAVVYPYFKLSENVGLAVSLAGGVQRDDSSRSFRFGGNANVDATVGIYRAWALKLSVSATNNRRAESGAFHGYSGAVVLIRRF